MLACIHQYKRSVGSCKALLEIAPEAWYDWQWTVDMSRKKAAPLSSRDRRRVRIQQIIFVLFAVIVIASFVISLVTS